jgi:hypothetical protein
MRLLNVSTRESPTPGHARVSGRVQHNGGAEEVVWVDVPMTLAGDLPERHDMWLLWLLPHAFETQCVLDLGGPVDATLLQNAQALMDIWCRWAPGRRPIAIRAEPVVNPGQRAAHGRRTGLFFTAGVDSYFSLLHHDEAIRAHADSCRAPIADLIYVWGFDVPLAHVEEYARKHADLKLIAESHGKSLVTLDTNLRQTGVERHWGEVMHGPALGGVALLLGSRLSDVLLSSWYLRSDPVDPCGSTPITDPLMSTAQTRTHPYGMDHGRFEKIALISRSQQALDSLHVCWKGGTARNCGICEKCLRTMIALEILGVRHRAGAFPRLPLDMGRLREVWVDWAPHIRLYTQLLQHAVRAGREDIASTIRTCLHGSGQPRP